MPELFDINSTEARLLIMLCREISGSEQSEASAELIGEVKDWNYFLRMANAHGVIALAASVLSSSGQLLMLPRETQERLIGAWRVNISRNALLSSRWKEVNAILSDSGIRHMLIKGMALEYSVYGARGVRQMNDIDIYISREKAIEAWELLQNFGFVPEALKSQLHKEIILYTGKHLPGLVKGGVSIEIHHKISSFSDQTADGEEIYIDGIKAIVPEPEIHAAYLISHLKYHKLKGEYQLRLSVDLEMLGKGGLSDISASHFAGAKSASGNRSKRILFRNAFYQVPPGDRLRFLAGDIFPSAEWMKKRYKCGNISLTFLYPYRLTKLLWLFIP